MCDYQDEEGFCPVCHKYTLFYAHHSFSGEWLYFCSNCNTSMSIRAFDYVQERKLRNGGA